jgi:hypothetical protein
LAVQVGLEDGVHELQPAVTVGPTRVPHIVDDDEPASHGGGGAPPPESGYELGPQRLLSGTQTLTCWPLKVVSIVQLFPAAQVPPADAHS